MNQNHDYENGVEEGSRPPRNKSPLSPSGNKLISRLLGPLADEVGQYLADIFRQWRWRRENFEKIAERCEIEKEVRGIDDDLLSAVSEGDAYRLAEACSFEDNEMVQELWAGLIISTIEPDKEVTMTRAFIEILKAIGPVEAGLLLVLSEFNHRQWPSISQDITKLGQEELSRLSDSINQANKEWTDRLKALAQRVYQRFPEGQKEIAIQNLFRLRCIGLRTGRNLAQSKMRSGLPIGVRSTDAAPTYDSFSKVADYLEWLILVGTGTGSYKGGPLSDIEPLYRSIPEIKFELTHLGRTLTSLCMTDALRQNVVREVSKPEDKEAD